MDESMNSIYQGYGTIALPNVRPMTIPEAPPSKAPRIMARVSSSVSHLGPPAMAMGTGQLFVTLSKSFVEAVVVYWESLATQKMGQYLLSRRVNKMEKFFLTLYIAS